MPTATARTYEIPTAGGAVITVTLSATMADSTWTCTGCGATESRFSEIGILAGAGAHAAQCGPRAVNGRLDTAVREVQAEMTRVDAKAAMLLTLAGAALTIALATLGRGDLPLSALAAGGITVALLAAGTVLLAVAVRPRLDNNFGFMRYARIDDAREVIAALNGPAGADPAEDRAYELRWTSIAVERKYLRVRQAVTLLLAGLAFATVTTLLALVLA